MKEAWFGIVGVIVGAIVGGVAQVLHVHVQAAVERKKALRAERRETYADFMRSLYLFAEGWGSHFDSPAGDPEPRSSLNALTAQFNASLSVMELVAPRDTYVEARTLALTVVEWWRSGDIPLVKDAESADLQEAAAFIQLAKRDLGVKG